MLQEKDSSLTKIFLLQTKNFLKKITDNAWKIYFKQQGKLKDTNSHSHYEASIPTTPKMHYQLPQMSKQFKENFKH